MPQSTNLNTSFWLDYFTCCNEKNRIVLHLKLVSFTEMIFSEKKADKNLHALDSNLKFLKDIEEMIL